MPKVEILVIQNSKEINFPSRFNLPRMKTQRILGRSKPTKYDQDIGTFVTMAEGNLGSKASNTELTMTNSRIAKLPKQLNLEHWYLPVFKCGRTNISRYQFNWYRWAENNKFRYSLDIQTWNFKLCKTVHFFQEQDPFHLWNKYRKAYMLPETPNGFSLWLEQDSV